MRRMSIRGSLTDPDDPYLPLIIEHNLSAIAEVVLGACSKANESMNAKGDDVDAATVQRKQDVLIFDGLLAINSCLKFIDRAITDAERQDVVNAVLGVSAYVTSQLGVEATGADVASSGSSPSSEGEGRTLESGASSRSSGGATPYRSAEEWRTALLEFGQLVRRQ